MKLGAHVRAGGGVWSAVEHGLDLGAESIQFFAGSPRTWKPMIYKEADAARFRELRAGSPITFSVIHSVYLINLATASDDFYEKSVTALAGAVAAAEQLGVEAVVNHTGSHQGIGFDVGLERVRSALRRVLDEVGDSKVRLLIENTAGAGGTMGVNFEEIAQIIHCVDDDPRIGVCLDTCHLYAAGYDVATEEGLEATLATFNATIGRERLVLIHLNDSMVPLRSNRDRHANIGDGLIGLDGFRRIINHPAFAELPGILEVPGYEGHGPDLRSMELVRSLQATP